MYDHVFQGDVFFIRGLLCVDEAVSVSKDLEVLTQRLAYLCGKGLGELDALSL